MFDTLCSRLQSSDENSGVSKELSFVGGVGSERCVKQVHHAILECEAELYREAYGVLIECGALSRGEAIQVRTIDFLNYLF